MKILDTRTNDLFSLRSQIIDVLRRCELRGTYFTGESSSAIVDDWLTCNNHSPSYFVIDGIGHVVCLVVTTKCSKSRLELSLVLTDPDKQGNGYARYAISHVMAACGKHKEMILDVSEYNSRAISLYESMGFKEYDRFSKMIRMQRSLKA